MCNATKNTHLLKAKKNKMSSLLVLPIDFTPSASDILCGRGNVFSNHEGNRYFGRIIRANLKESRDAASRPEKIRVVDDILQEIRASGVRFAKLDSETKRWYELNDVLAHQKIGHAIRDTIRLLKDKTKKYKRKHNEAIETRETKRKTKRTQTKKPCCPIVRHTTKDHGRHSQNESRDIRISQWHLGRLRKRTTPTNIVHVRGQ